MKQFKQKSKTEAELGREEGKLQREEGKREIEKLEKEEAMYNQADPADEHAIDEALRTFGDYKLKMSPDYIVPEKDGVNAEKKKQQMVLLENSIFNLGVDFNKKLDYLKK